MKLKIGQKLKSIVSLITVISLILGTLSISLMNSIAATTVDHSNVEYTIPKFKTNSDSTGNTKEKLETYTGWWSYFLDTNGINNIADNGGVVITYKNEATTNIAVSLDNTFNIKNGLSVKLEASGPSGETNRLFYGINLSASSSANASPLLSIQIDGVNGKVSYIGYKNIGISETVIVTDNKLKSMADKTVYIDLVKRSNAGFDLVMDIAGDVITSATPIPASAFTAAGITDDTVYVGISGKSNTRTPTTVKWLGVGTVPEPTIHEKASYTVPRFKTSTDPATGLGNWTLNPRDTYLGWWSTQFDWDNTNDIPNNGGLKITYKNNTGGGNWLPISVKNSYNFDRLSFKLKAKGIGVNDANYLGFSINLSSLLDCNLTTGSGAGKANSGAMSITVDGKAGNVVLNVYDTSLTAGTPSATTLLSDDAVIKNMADKQIYIDILKKNDDSGDYELKIYACAQVTSATISANAIAKTNFSNSEKIYTALSGLTNAGLESTEIQWQGVCNLPKEITYTNISLNDSKLDYIGRAYYNSNDSVLNLDMSNSGVAFKTKATGVKIKLKTEAPSDGETWQKCFVKVFVDGAETKHFEVTVGNNEYEIATGLDPEKETEIKLIKVTESKYSFLDITELKVAGELCEITKKPIKIEVIGDSIISGYGALSTPVTTDPAGNDFKSSEEDSSSSYTAYLAQKYGYELSVISSSGGGLYSDSNGKTAGESEANIVTDMYDYYIAPNSRRFANGYSAVAYNHTEHPDIIIIDLGTNDAVAMNAAGDKEAFKTEFLNTAKSFVEKLHNIHPNAKIVWTYGLMNSGLTPTLNKLDDNLSDEIDFTFIEQPSQSVFSDKVGADNHPHKETHKLVSDYIYNELNGIKASHTDRAYIIPVLTTDEVEGNTVLDQATYVKWWSKYSDTPYNLSGNTGVHMGFNHGVSGMRMSINKKLYLNTLSLKMGNIGTAGDKETVHFSLVISNDRNAEYNATNGAMKITLNGGSGNAKVYVKGQAVGTILDDSPAVLATMAGKSEVYIDFNKANDDTGDYLITVFSGVQSVTDRITAEMFNNVTFDPDKQIYIGITADSPSGAQKATSYDFLGVCDIIATQKTTELINAIGTVNLADGSPIKKARAAYDALEKAEKETISNYQILLDAEKEYDRLADEADKDLIPASIHTAHFVNHIDADNVQGTLAAWKKYMQISDVKTGGQRFNFSGASSHIREGFSHFISIDGLYLQFDNFIRSTDASGKFALIFGGEEYYIADWSETAAKKSFGLLFDTLNGTVSTMGSEITPIITNDGLKYSALEQKRFSIEIKEKNYVYTVSVKVGGNTYSGTFSSDIFKETLSLKNPNSCRFVISAWGSSQYYSLDLIGVGKDTAVNNVKSLIDDIGIVNNGSKAAIEKASKAYDALSGNEKLRVTNYTALENAIAYYEKIASKYTVDYVIEKIEDVGVATLENGDQINEAYDAYCNLSTDDKKKVTNSDALFKALDDFYKTVNNYAEYEKFVYAALNSSEAYDATWDDRVTYKINDDNTMHIEYKDARRDMLQGTKKQFDLNGLRIELANITPAKGENGVKFAIQFNRTNWPIFNTGATGVALVVDTYSGEIRAFPGNHLIIKSDTLKQNNIKNSSVQFNLRRGSDYVYRLRTITPTGTVEAAIPTSAIEFLYSSTTKGTYFAIGPWTDCSDGLRDNTAHSFSLDVVSAYSELSTDKYVFSQVVSMEQELEELSSNFDDHTLVTIQEIVNKYRKLNNHFKALIKNYSKLSKILNYLYEAESLEKYGTDFEGEEPDYDSGNSPLTGSASSNAITVLVAAVALAGVFISSFGFNRSGRKGKGV